MTKKKVFMMVLLFIIFSLIGYGIYEVCISHPKDYVISTVSSKGETKKIDNNGEAVDGAAKSKTSNEVLDDLKKSQINVTDKLGSHIIFPSGKAGAQGSWIVENVETNNVVMQCEVYLNNKLIAKSVPIKPKQHINKVTLANDLKAGIYDVIAYINYFKLNTNEYISKAGFKVKLTVQ